jgi:hypothetical protein
MFQVRTLQCRDVLGMPVCGGQIYVPVVAVLCVWIIQKHLDICMTQIICGIRRRGQFVHAIPDVVLAGLLHQWGSARCFSASGTGSSNDWLLCH